MREERPDCECGNPAVSSSTQARGRSPQRPVQDTFDEAVAQARAGDIRATKALERAGDLIGLAIANVLIFLCPQRVVIGGGVVQAGELLLGPLRHSIAERARVAPLDRIAIATAELGPHAGAIDAALWGAEP